jgi:hypothetical protein
MPPAEPYGVGTPQAGVEKDLHCKSLWRAYGPSFAERRYVFLGPCPVAIRSVPDALGGADRIVGTHASANCPFHYGGKPFAEIASRGRSGCHVIYDCVDVLRSHLGNWAVAMLSNETIKDAAMACVVGASVLNSMLP